MNSKNSGILSSYFLLMAGVLYTLIVIYLLRKVNAIIKHALSYYRKCLAPVGAILCSMP